MPSFGRRIWLKEAIVNIIHNSCGLALKLDKSGWNLHGSRTDAACLCQLSVCRRLHCDLPYGPAELSRYSDLLQVGRSRDRTTVSARDFLCPIPVQADPGPSQPFTLGYRTWGVAVTSHLSPHLAPRLRMSIAMPLRPPLCHP